MVKRRKKSSSNDLEPLNGMIDLMGAAAMGAFTRYKVKSDYKKGCGEESIKAVTMVYGMNAMRRGSTGTLALAVFWA